MFGCLIGGCLSEASVSFHLRSPLPLYLASIVKWFWSLFSPMMHLEKHVVSLLRLSSSPFSSWSLHPSWSLSCTLQTWNSPRRGSGGPADQTRSLSLHSSPPFILSSPPPRSSTSTLMMPVKGFLPNLSALMFASLLWLTGKKIPK